MAVHFNVGPTPNPDAVRLPATVILSGSLKLVGNATRPERAILEFGIESPNVVFIDAAGRPTPVLSGPVRVPPPGLPFNIPVRLHGDAPPPRIIVIRAMVNSIDHPGFPSTRFVQIRVD